MVATRPHLDLARNEKDGSRINTSNTYINNIENTRKQWYVLQDQSIII